MITNVAAGNSLLRAVIQGCWSFQSTLSFLPARLGDMCQVLIHADMVVCTVRFINLSDSMLAWSCEQTFFVCALILLHCFNLKKVGSHGHENSSLTPTGLVIVQWVTASDEAGFSALKCQQMWYCRPDKEGFCRADTHEVNHPVLRMVSLRGPADGTCFRAVQRPSWQGKTSVKVYPVIVMGGEVLNRSTDSPYDGHSLLWKWWCVPEYAFSPPLLAELSIGMATTRNDSFWGVTSGTLKPNWVRFRPVPFSRKIERAFSQPCIWWIFMTLRKYLINQRMPN